jgi:hypothetical protein
VTKPPIRERESDVAQPKSSCLSNSTMPPTPTSPSTSPRISAAHPALKYAGQVGEMADVKLVSLAKSEWEKPDIKEEIMAKLSSLQGVSSVEAVELQKQRMKRGEL